MDDHEEDGWMDDIRSWSQHFTRQNNTEKAYGYIRSPLPSVMSMATAKPGKSLVSLF